MRDVIIGTAGHIDHGKSSLIRRLTGIDPDRWEEEKKRGITIDLGFSFFDLPNSKRVGIVDVPGHEKFIKNMLAGVSGIDLVLFVVALDEGVMPQTLEHLSILSLLELKRGIIVLTKSDMVDDEMIELVQSDVKEHVTGTFLENAPMICVSSVTGDGFDELIAQMDKDVSSIQFMQTNSDARLPVDRAFSLQGVGTVITGTLIEGEIAENEQMMLYPIEKSIRIRKIQNHNQPVDKAYGGQRIALNVTGIEKSDISRGDVVATAGSMRSSMMIDVSFQMLKGSPKTMKNWDRLRLYIGTKEVLCRAVILDKEEIATGETGLLQLRLEEQIACKYGDRFVIRSYSPLITIGGGMVLDSCAKKHKRFKKDIIDSLNTKKDGDKNQIVIEVLHHSTTICTSVEDVSIQTGFEQSEVRDILQNFKQQQMAIELLEDKWVSANRFDVLKKEIEDRLERYHSDNPLSEGMSKEELRNNMFPELKGKLADAMYDYLASNSNIRIKGSNVHLCSFKISFTDAQMKRIDAILTYFTEVGTKPPTLADVYNELKITKNDEFLLSNLLKTGKIVQIDDKIWIGADVINTIKSDLIDYFNSNNEITVGDFRDLVGTSRKNAIAILEYLDELKFTRRNGNVRTKAKA